MKNEIKVKHLLKKNQNAGFTLIELLVVIIIIGILTAIALPSFLNQTAKSRAAETKTNVGAMNRAQQAYFLERQTFTTDVDELGLSMVNSTDNFDYSAAPNGTITTGVTNFGTSKKDDITSYVGAVFYVTGATETILCEANQPSAVAATPPNSSTDCATGNRRVQ